MSDKNLLILGLASLFFGLFVIIIIACGSDKNIMKPDPEQKECEEIIFNDPSEALSQIMNSDYSDPVVSAQVLGDSVINFSTSRYFLYTGEELLDNITVLRGLILWSVVDGEKIIIGTSYSSSISTSAEREIPAVILEPDTWYFYWVNWDNKPFFASKNIFFINFYFIKGTQLDKKIINFKGKSMIEALNEYRKKEVL